MTRSIRALDLHFPSLAGDADLPGRVAAALDDLSPAAVHETGDDDRPTWRIFPADHSQLDVMASTLAAAFGPAGCRLERVEVEDEDWAARTQADLTRVAVGRLIVSPPWDVPEALPPGSHLVVIQPSMGFGTGHHETTRLCLRLLQDVDLGGPASRGSGHGIRRPGDGRAPARRARRRRPRRRRGRARIGARESGAERPAQGASRSGGQTCEPIASSRPTWFSRT